MELKRILSRVWIFGIALIGLYVLQVMVMPYLPVAGTKPLILPLFVTGVALFCGTNAGGAIGIIAGMLCDLSVHDSGVLYSCILPLCGIITGLIAENYLARGFPSYLLCCVCTLLIVAAGQVFGLLVYDGVPFNVLGRIAIYQSLYSLVFLIPVYWISRGVYRRLAREN